MTIVVSKTLEIGNTKYGIYFKLDEYNHLCTFREMCDLNLTKQELDKKFNTYTELSYKQFNEKDYKIFAYLTYEAVKELEITRDVKGFLFTLVTGNRSKWEYTLKQQATVMPLIKRYLPIATSTVLYKDDVDSEEDVYELEGTSKDDGYEELTLYNLPYKEFKKPFKYQEEVEAIIKANKEDKFKLTKEDVRNYLEGLQ